MTVPLDGSLPSIFGYHPGPNPPYRFKAYIQDYKILRDNSSFPFYGDLNSMGERILTNEAVQKSLYGFTDVGNFVNGLLFTVNTPADLTAANLKICRIAEKKAISRAKKGNFYREHIAKIKVVDFTYIDKNQNVIRYLQTCELISDGLFICGKDTETLRQNIFKKFNDPKILEVLDCLHFRENPQAIRHRFSESDILSSALLSQMSGNKIPFDLAESLLARLGFTDSTHPLQFLRETSSSRLTQNAANLRNKFFTSKPPRLELIDPIHLIAEEPIEALEEKMCEIEKKLDKGIDLSKEETQFLANYSLLKEAALQKAEAQRTKQEVDILFERYKHIVFHFLRYSLSLFSNAASTQVFRIKWLYDRVEVTELCQFTNKFALTRRIEFPAPYGDLPYFSSSQAHCVLSVWNSFYSDEERLELESARFEAIKRQEALNFGEDRNEEENVLMSLYHQKEKADKKVASISNRRDQRLASYCLSLYEKGQVECDQHEKDFIVPLTLLLFGVEPSRDRASLISNYILMKCVAQGTLSFEEALNKLPMAPNGAVSTGHFTQYITSKPFNTLSRIYKSGQKAIENPVFGQMTQALAGPIAAVETTYQEIGLQAAKYFSQDNNAYDRTAQAMAIDKFWQQHPLGKATSFYDV